MRIRDSLKVAMAFALSGALAGVLFGELVAHSAEEFWFIRGSKYLIPRLSYWIGHSVVLAMGILVGHCGSVLLGWLGHSKRPSVLRQIIATVILVVSFPLGQRFSLARMEDLDPVMNYITAYAVVIILNSLALWIFTSAWKKWPALLLFLALPVVLVISVVLSLALNLSDNTYATIKIASLAAWLSGVSGYWFARSRVRVV
jgi:hypothetical protein